MKYSCPPHRGRPIRFRHSSIRFLQISYTTFFVNHSWSWEQRPINGGRFDGSLSCWRSSPEPRRLIPTWSDSLYVSRLNITSTPTPQRHPTTLLSTSLFVSYWSVLGTLGNCPLPLVSPPSLQQVGWNGGRWRTGVTSTLPPRLNTFDSGVNQSWPTSIKESPSCVFEPPFSNAVVLVWFMFL